jgi:uncharacterized protein (DUF58 family)
MCAEVEVRVIDPDGMREVERHAMDALPISRDEVDPLFDRLLDANRAATARELRLALKDVDRAEVQRRLWAFGIEEPSVSGGERLVVRLLGAQALAAASNCALSSFFKIFPVAPLGSVSTN